ncbi:MAG: hypothetical protein M1835_001573 [Candelina submexicana]|nr:MAG: hypothetical protein M1835_001573 [Candelina submexicana]
MAQQNPFLLAADNSPQLPPLLHSNPSLASSQDTHGYSLVHAAASYHHLDLLRALVNDFGVSVNIKDEDGETALFSAESVEVAKCLVEELGANLSIRNDEGMTAEENIFDEGDWPLVAAYLREVSSQRANATRNGAIEPGTADVAVHRGNGIHAPPPLPPNVTVNVGTMEDATHAGDREVDPDFKRRIDELAAREDFQGEEGQRELRNLITDAVRGVEGDGREVRRRIG